MDCIHEIVVINCGLTLQEITVVKQEKEGILFCPLFTDVIIYVRQGMVGRGPADKVVWVNHTVYICCYSNPYGDLILFAGGEQEQKYCHQVQNPTFFCDVI